MDDRGVQGASGSPVNKTTSKLGEEGEADRGREERRREVEREREKERERKEGRRTGKRGRVVTVG